ncbi:AbrB/MazE/SpoVT family DNA-binding domain-containing protein [Nostoc sp. HG1]|nr:AbrB/MazE/SpoVT family DNA-binding domain-containing protein [Nostoc sp. HG1]
MSASIRTRIVSIGNFQGICISKTLLEQSGIYSDAEIEVQGNQLIIRAAALQLRNNWDTAFSSMATQRDDILLDEASTTDWDQAEWEW